MKWWCSPIDCENNDAGNDENDDDADDADDDDDDDEIPEDEVSNIRDGIPVSELCSPFFPRDWTET